jgi:type IV secretory pathway TraG/TraD family ATPase VirD4
MWVTLVATQLILLGLAVVAIRLVRFVRGATGTPGGSPMKANRSHVKRRMGRRAVDRHTAALYGKDAVAGREPLALGVDVATGTPLFAKSEDYILAVGVPRVGKGEGFVIPAVLRHKGSAVVTATRHDTYMDTACARERVGPVFVFDPQGLVPYAEKLRWNPVKGCEVPQKAILRARGFAGFAGVGAAVDGGGAYWEQVAASIIRSYLHAAALEGLGVEQLLDWSRRPAARQPVRILSRHSDAARGWNEDLAASTEVEPRHRDSIWATVRRAFDCFADPMVLEATRVDHDTFDPTAFLDGHGTIYLMGSPGAQHSVAPIVAALIEDIVDVARHQAAALAARRLESGLVLMLDECANIAPLGDLPKLVAELGGLGITTAVILQSVASARSIWGEAGERALRDLANITLVWGGQKDIAFLEEISRLAGEHDELVETVTHNDNGKSSSWTPRRTAVLPVWDIANLAPYHAVVVSPHLRPRVTHLSSWRKDRTLTALAEQGHGTSLGAATGG